MREAFFTRRKRIYPRAERGAARIALAPGFASAPKPETGAVLYSARGFTLIEIILAIAIFVAISVSAVATGYNFYGNYVLTSERDNFVGLLRNARSLAMANNNESGHGVYVSTSTGRYILFQGDSYASRNQTFDVPLPMSQAVAISGPAEIVFSALDGASNVSGMITIASRTGTEEVGLNYEGGIDW